MAATSEGPSQLFVGSLPVTLLQPNKNGPEYMSTVADVSLKIVERRLDSGEKEYRIEISRPDDFEFLYAEGITRTKYQTLAKTWNLNVDFDDFPARIVRLLRERVGATSPVQLTCTLSQDLSICTFEMIHIIDMYTVRMPIELRAVRDKDLLCHIINNMRSLQKQLCKLNKERKDVEKERDELNCMVDDLKEFRLKADQRIAELEQRVKDAEKRAADETLRREEFEQDLQLERDERDSALSTIEHLKDELADAEKKVRELEEDLDQCEEECEELEGKKEKISIFDICFSSRSISSRSRSGHMQCVRGRFEMIHIIDMYTVRMPIELRAVRDKDLLCHIINNMRSLQLERDERDSALSTIEHLKDELADAEKKVRELEEDLDQCEEECEELEGKLRDSEVQCCRLRGDKEKLAMALDKTKKDLSKANHVISKYLKGDIRSPSERSLDERKDEMAADLKMKESLIDEMTASIADYKKTIDDLSRENKELQETLQVMEAERARNARVIEMYRNQHRVGSALSPGVSPPLLPVLGTIGGRTSPLLGCVPTTPSNFRNVLGRTLQSNTALLTPSIRSTPPALQGKFTNSDGRENMPPPTLGIGPTVAPPK
nr:Protein SAS-6 [Haemonchus contortus]